LHKFLDKDVMEIDLRFIGPRLTQRELEQHANDLIPQLQDRGLTYATQTWQRAVELTRIARINPSWESIRLATITQHELFSNPNTHPQDALKPIDVRTITNNS
jgi:hypothetical protein